MTPLLTALIEPAFTRCALADVAKISVLDLVLIGAAHVGSQYGHFHDAFDRGCEV